MRQAEQDGEHIWLRQSVTFTVAGQTRTVEIAIPLRPGATAEDVEALLSEADAGMERLSRRLDGRVAALLGGAAQAVTATQPPLSGAAPAQQPQPAPEAPETPEASEATPHPERPPTPAPQAASTPPPRTAARAHEAANAATPSPARPTPPATPARPSPPSAARPEPPAPTPAPARARASGQLAAGPTSAGPDLTRPEFITAAQELGLNIKQAMERLGVRSLEGLNLREALEALRRQAVRGDAAPAAPAPPPARAAAPASTPPARESAPAEPRYFDEEDDLDVTFTVDGDEVIEEEFAPYGASGPGDGDVLDDIEELDLDDVPDFGPPPSASRGRTSTTRRAATPARPQPESTAAEEPPAGPDVTGASGDRARALQLVGQMRSARGGGAPSSHQRTAYRNVVARELGEPEATALVRGLWRTTPDRLSAEQLDALISWGKQDTFSEEATIVLAELRAERARANAAEQPSPASGAPQSAPRGRGAGTGRSAPGGG